MKFSNVRLLVKDFTKCFRFYANQLGLEPAWGDEDSCYASFKVAEGIEGLSLFVSDWMAPSAGNADKQQPIGMREKSLISFRVDNVDATYTTLKAKGVTFINEPIDMPDWGMRTVHLRDPEENLIELFSPLAPEQYSKELIEEDKKYQKNDTLGNDPICQSCGMNMKTAEAFGTNADGTKNTEYCHYCYQNGVFTHDVTMDEMLETNLKYLDHWNAETGNNFTPDEARPMLREFLSNLKRWKKN